MTDPTMPRVMPPEVKQELTKVIGYRDRPYPIDVYNAIRDMLVEMEKGRSR